jgi:hypothetical protein
MGRAIAVDSSRIPSAHHANGVIAPVNPAQNAGRRSEHIEETRFRLSPE